MGRGHSALKQDIEIVPIPLKDCLTLLRRILLDPPTYDPLRLYQLTIVTHKNRWIDDVLEHSVTRTPISTTENENYSDLISEIQSLIKENKVDPASQKNLPLRFACFIGHLELVKILLEDPRVDPSARNNATIIFAAVRGHDEIVRILLKDPRVYPSTEMNLLMEWYAHKRDLPMLDLIMNHPDFDPAHKVNSTLTESLRDGNTPVVKKLYKYLNKIPDKESLLEANLENLEMVQFLIDSVSFDQDYFSTTLRKVCRYGNVECFQLLESTFPSFTINHLQCLDLHLNDTSSPNVSLMTYLIEKAQTATKASFACALTLGDIPLIKLCMQHFDPFQYEFPLLSFSVKSGKMEVIDLFYNDERVDPSADHNDALLKACEMGNPELFQKIFSHPRLQLRFREDYQFFFQACSDGNVPIIKLILADPRIDPSIFEQNAFKEAISHDRLEVTKLLLQDPRVNTSYIDEDKIWTIARLSHETFLFAWHVKSIPYTRFSDLLMASSSAGQAETVRWLLQNGTFFPEDNLSEALEHAIRVGNRPLVQILLNDPRIDPTKIRCVHRAVELGDPEMIQLLLKDPRIHVKSEDVPGFIRDSSTPFSTYNHDNFIKLFKGIPWSDLAWEHFPHEYKVIKTILDHVDIASVDPSTFSEFCNERYGDTSIETIELFMSLGFDPTAGFDAALPSACTSYAVEAIQLLLQDPRVDPSQRKNAALRTSINSGQFCNIRTLLQDPRVDASIDDNAIFLKARKRNFPVVQRALEHPSFNPFVGINFSKDLEEYASATKTEKRSSLAMFCHPKLNFAVACAAVIHAGIHDLVQFAPEEIWVVILQKLYGLQLEYLRQVSVKEIPEEQDVPSVQDPGCATQ